MGQQSVHPLIRQIGAAIVAGAAGTVLALTASAGVVDTKALPKLTYEFDALEPYIDETTMKTHYSKHHQAYVSKLNAALEKAPDLQNKNLVELVQAVGTRGIPEDIQGAVRNQGGGHWNHSMFWKLKAAIKKDFGDVGAFKKKFGDAAAGVFGSGWAWLQVDPSSKDLAISTTSNQDNPLMKVVKSQGYPVLGLDVWEHAYKNARPEYINIWWNVVNWEQVSKNYAAAKQGQAAASA
eukprot:jgi/Astpho2/8614/Aster-05093